MDIHPAGTTALSYIPPKSSASSTHVNIQVNLSLKLLATENLGDLHAMIPGFTDLIGVFAIKVDDDEDYDDGFITITRFFLQYQLRLQRTSSCSKIHFVPPLFGELLALYHLFDFLHPHV